MSKANTNFTLTLIYLNNNTIVAGELRHLPKKETTNWHYYQVKPDSPVYVYDAINLQRTNLHCSDMLHIRKEQLMMVFDHVTSLPTIGDWVDDPDEFSEEIYRDWCIYESTLYLGVERINVLIKDWGFDNSNPSQKIQRDIPACFSFYQHMDTFAEYLAENCRYFDLSDEDHLDYWKTALKIIIEKYDISFAFGCDDFPQYQITKEECDGCGPFRLE
jgi:hypothetical protein